ncbi:DNA-entry nuclease [Aeribacillus pallidus]|nr:DNA-entry nuclease [Aeribacillus pallidus]
MAQICGKEDALSVEYDNFGRMKYHPSFHENRGKPFTESDLEYICKFYEFDGPELISLALGRTEKTIMTKVYELRKQGLYDYYKNLNKYWI